MKFMTCKTRWLVLIICQLMALSVMAETHKVGVPLSELAEHPLRRAPATALSLNQSLLSAQIQAKVDSIAVGVSQAVKRGDTLLTLDCTDYDLQLAMAEAGVEMAEARLSLAKSQQQRSNQLLQKQVASQEAADTTAAEAVARAAELQQAKLTRRQAEVDKDRCIIRAPFDGLITERLIGEGQLASVGSALIAITDTDRIELSAFIKPEEINQLKAASELVFEAAGQYPVKVLRWGGAVNTKTRNLEIRLTFTGPQPPPGSAGNLVWRDPRPFIPPEYVVTREQRLGVFTVNGGRAVFHPLPQAIPGRAVAVDLPGSTRIVTDNLGGLNAGDTL